MRTGGTDTLIGRGGQAGIALSEHLGEAGVPLLVLERHRSAERWRSARWNSLVSKGPAWHHRFPNMTFPGAAPGDFVSNEPVADYFVAYARMIEAQRVVTATGSFQKPVVPLVIPAVAGVMQIHSSANRNPDQLPEGAVLVVGAASSGVQIADELQRAGRQVYLSVGPHDRPPRRYRGRDFTWWLGVLGKWDMATPGPGTEHVTIAVSGAQGGQTVDFRRMAEQGMVLVGRTEAYAEGCVQFAGDLARKIAEGDANYLSVLDEADAWVARNGFDLPEEPEARQIGRDPACLRDPLRGLDLARAGVSTVLWATGYALDYGWLRVDAFDAQGRPRHQRGVSSEPGVHFPGLPWQSRRGSSFIWGVWHDAKFIADQIGIQHGYMEHDAAARASQSRA